MSALVYEQLALEWSPQKGLDKQFSVIALIVVLTMVAIGVRLSSIPIPETQRTTRNVIPERIANFILEKKKAEPKVEKPKPIEKLKPKPKPKPKVKKEQPKKKSDKPLTQTQKKAREIAAESGLLALSDELSDLIDITDIAAMVGAKVIPNSTASTQATSPDTEALIADASQGSGGVNSDEFTTIIGKTALVGREVVKLDQPLAKLEDPDQTDKAKDETRPRTAEVRRTEDITLIIDRNKGKLYSVYNRALRRNPGLKGKIILELTIAPSGKVVKIRIVSSELGDPKLESGLVSRIKLFDFGARNVEQVTVTYPIEFLPS